MDTVCEVCGNIGYKHLLVCCRDCKCSAVHLYCLDKVIFDASLAEWWCDECLQRRGEVPCSRSLERVSSQRSPNHDHFGSTVQQQVTKRVKSAKNAGPRRKSKAEDIPSAKYSLDSDDLQASSKAHYVLSYRSYLSEAQKQRVMAFIKEIQPKITVFVAVMLKRNVQPPGPFLEGDICLLFPTAGGRRYTFTVYLFCASATHSIGRAGFQMVCPCPGRSSTKMASEVHIMEESTNDEHISLETDMREISDDSLEGEDSGGLSQPPYIVPCRNSI
uniref:Zinc finger PHD-type domain-containing protein n=1 Tax=Setaria viridis TaxID=4556 RepID=A0A4U6SW22_SETVI|nr:hypothetical protein SEVIR_9G164800v2 [Setaria viridis]